MPLDTIDYLWLASPVTFGIATSGLLSAEWLLSKELRSPIPEVREKAFAVRPGYGAMFAIGSAAGVLTLFAYLFISVLDSVMERETEYEMRVLLVAIPYLFVVAAVGFHTAALACATLRGLERVPLLGRLLRWWRERREARFLFNKLFSDDAKEREGAATELAKRRPSVLRARVRAELHGGRLSGEVVRVFAAFEGANGVDDLCGLATRFRFHAQAAVRALANDCGAAGADAVLRLFDESNAFDFGTCGRAAAEQIIAAGEDDALSLIVAKVVALPPDARHPLYRMLKFRASDAVLNALPTAMRADLDREFDRSLNDQVQKLVQGGMFIGGYISEGEAPRIREAKYSLEAIPDRLVVRPLIACVATHAHTMQDYSTFCSVTRDRLVHLTDPRAVELLCRELTRSDSPVKVMENRMAKERYRFGWLDWGTTAHGYTWVRLKDGKDSPTQCTWFVRSPDVVLRYGDATVMFKIRGTWLPTPHALRPAAGELTFPKFDAAKRSEYDEALARIVAAWGVQKGAGRPGPAERRGVVVAR